VNQPAEDLAASYPGRRQVGDRGCRDAAAGRGERVQLGQGDDEASDESGVVTVMK
jgi:hypothetical protein